MTKYKILDILPNLVGTRIKSKSTGYCYTVLRAVVDEDGVLWYHINNIFGSDDREYWRANKFTVIHNIKEWHKGYCIHVEKCNCDCSCGNDAKDDDKDDNNDNDDFEV